MNEEINKLKYLIIGLEANGIKITRIGKGSDNVSVDLNIKDIEIIVEYYDDGDIALVAVDNKSKNILECVDLKENEVLPTILKYYK
jgi:hypothetical protein